MATVSDLISIQLQIDTGNLQQTGDIATREIEKVKRTIQQQGSEIERIMKDLGSSVATAIKYVASLMGVVLSFEGFKSMVHEVTDAGTSLGRFSEAIGVAAGRVGALEQALARAGGRADDVRPVLAALKSDMTRVSMGGAPAEWQRSLGLAPIGLGIQDIQRLNSEQLLREISRRAQAAHMTAGQLQQLLPGLPLSEETLAVLVKPGELERQLAGTQGTAPTPAQIAAAERLKEKFATLEQLSAATMRDLVTIAEPWISKAIDWVNTALEWFHLTELKILGAPPSVSSVAPGTPATRSALGLPAAPSSPLTRSLGPAPGSGASSTAAPWVGGDVSLTYDPKGNIVGGIDRSRFVDEIMRKPWLVNKMASMVQGEVGKGAPTSTKIVQLETAFNRAQARGISLEQALLSVGEDPQRGYYARDTYHPVTQEQVDAFKHDVLGPVMHGSDISSQPGKGPMTGNASGTVAFHQYQRGTPGYNLPAAGGQSESYFSEGPFRYPFPRYGAGAALEAPMPENKTINNERTTVVNHVDVHTTATDASSIAKDVKNEIGKQLSAPEQGGP